MIEFIIGFILGMFLVTAIANYISKNRQVQQDNENIADDSERVVIDSVPLPEQELVISPLPEDCDNI